MYFRVFFFLLLMNYFETQNSGFVVHSVSKFYENFSNNIMNVNILTIENFYHNYSVLIS